MAKILVQSPKTINGRDVKLGADGRVIYRDTILEAAARPIFEKMNTRLPDSLKHKISDYTEGTGAVTVTGDVEEAKAKVKQRKNATA